MILKKFPLGIFQQAVTKQTGFLFAAIFFFGLLLLPAKCFAQFAEYSTRNKDFNPEKTSVSGTEFYAAPSGSSTGDGSINNPWDLKTALSRSTTVVPPGSTVWLRGGVYKIPTVELQFVSTLSGTAANPIKVSSYPGEWATIDGNASFSTFKNKTILHITGSFVWFMNFEITNTETSNRKIDVTGSNPPERRATAVDDRGTGTKLINLVIHDCGQGIGSWSNGSDTEYYGNIVYNNGWDAPDRTHGHGTYVQNDVGQKFFENNIFFNNFAMNARTGGTGAAFTHNLNYIGNTYFNGIMAWKGPEITNFKVIGNNFYNNPLKVGDQINSTYMDAEIRDNYAMSGVQLFEFVNSVIFQNNTVWNNNPSGRNLVISHDTPSIESKFSIDNNYYYKSFMGYPYWHFKINYYGTAGSTPTSRYGDFAYNKTSGSQVTAYSYTGKSWVDTFPFDAHSTYIDAAPTGLKVFFQPNRYDSKRANLVIYNWDQANTVSVNLGSFLNSGDTYELRNVQDYFGDVITGTYAGGNLQVPMAGRKSAKPIGYDQTTTWYHNPLWPNTFPIMGAFVLIKTNGVQNPVNQAPIVNAGTDQTINISNSANLNGTASDDGLPNSPASLTTQWSKVSGPGTVSFGNANSLNTTAGFSAAGTYILRLTANDSALSSTDDVTITATNSSTTGVLSVSSAISPARVSLTTEGAADWAQWGMYSVTDFTRKTGVAQQISNYTRIGSGNVLQFPDNTTSFAWNDGAPTAAASNITGGIWIPGANNGFKITVPADTTQKTLKLYVGLWAAGGKLEASLSDSSAPVYTDTSAINSTSTSNLVYTLNFRAASAGQTLTVKWTVNSSFNSWGNVTLQAATLNSGQVISNQPPVVNAGNDQTLILPNRMTLNGSATDDGLPSSPGTLTVQWSKVSGRGLVSFGNANSLTTTAGFSIAGTYVLRLTVSDGLLTTTDEITVVAKKR